MFCEFCIVPTANFFFLNLDIQLVTKSEAGNIPSTPQPSPSCHPPSSESQTVDRTERDEPLDGPTAPDQLTTSDHGTGSHVLNSENQSTCVLFNMCS